MPYSLFPAAGGGAVPDVQQPPADQEGQEGVDESVGEYTAYGILAQLGYSESGEPAGGVAEEVVAGDGEACDLGEQHSLRPPSPHGAGAGGEHGRDQAP